MEAVWFWTLPSIQQLQPARELIVILQRSRQGPPPNLTTHFSPKQEHREHHPRLPATAAPDDDLSCTLSHRGVFFAGDFIL